MMNRNLQNRPVHHLKRGIGRQIENRPKKEVLHSPNTSNSGARLNHNSPYPFYYYQRIIFKDTENLKTINIKTRMNEALVLKSITLHYAENYIGTDDNGTPFDGCLFNRNVKVEIYKVENNRKISNKPLPVELFCQIGKFGTQVIHGTTVDAAIKAEFKGYTVAPVSPFVKPVYDLKKGNSMALDELIPSNGNLFMNVFSEIENANYIPHLPIVPMAVDVIIKAICIPNIDTLQQKAY